MRPSTHILVGAAVGAFVGSATGANPLELLIIGAAAAIMPDLDVLTRLASRRPHRSEIMHSLLGAAIITLGWAILYSVVRLDPTSAFDTVPALRSVLVVFVASFLHPAADALTNEGCALWYPMSAKPIKGRLSNTDARSNLAIVLAAVCVTLFALIVEIHELF